MTQTNTEQMAEGILSGDRRMLARAITLVESTRPDHRERAQDLLQQLMPETGKSARVGISGVPGVGKSTFIEAFGNHVIEQGHKLAVLAVDPSSKRSGGSILGDKTRMETLSRNPAAFIRPSPTAGMLGGVARRTREAMLLCEAAGHDIILVETVGVGQSETAVAEMTDMFLLLLLPGGGDELQGLKKGIVELADLIIVNKADGDRRDEARRSAAQYASALQLIRAESPDWTVPVQTCSALEGNGIDTVWETIGAFMKIRRDSGALARERAEQALDWMWGEVQDRLMAAFRRNGDLAATLEAVQTAVRQGEMPPTLAARQLVERFIKAAG